MSASARSFAALIAIVAAAALCLRFLLALPDNDGNPLLVIWNLGRFFTILTNTATMLTLGAIACGARPSERWLGGVCLSITLVGLLYHVLLAHLVDLSGMALVADHGVHTAVPALALVWWVVSAPKGNLGFIDTLWWLVWPSVYSVYAITRGIFDGVYPYPFLDLGTLGWSGLIPGIAMLLGGFLVAGAVFLGIARLTAR